MTALLVTDRPDHPVLRQVLTLLEARNGVVVLDPGDPGQVAALTSLLFSHPPHVVLLKSHDDAAIEVGRAAARSGVRVLNDPDATAGALDRDQMARTARAAAIPFPVTSGPFLLGRDAERVRALAELGLPVGAEPAPALLVKSRRSRRGDLVTRVASVAELDALAGDWPDEEVVLQPAVPFDGWDHKVWVVGEEIFHARRRTPLAPPDAVPDQVSVDDQHRSDGLPDGWGELVARIGRAYGLCIYGVDLLDTPEGPVVVDVNPFPGGRSVPGVAEAIARLADSATGPAWLHALVRERVGRNPQPADEPLVLSVRCKPGRGLVVGYRAQGRRLTARSRPGSDVPELFWFPDDPDLPALAAVMAAAPEVAGALERLGRPPIRVSAVRYKPGERCVVRFDLADAAAVYGKVFARPELAVEADRIHRLLWDAAVASSTSPWVARPVGVLAGLGLTLVEAVPGRPPRTADELVGGAELLARLHSAGLGPATVTDLPVRELGPDLRRLRERAAALAVGGPSAAVVGLAERLAGVLQDADPEPGLAVRSLTHGAFKPSQLVSAPGRPVVVVDLDGVAVGDPARDLGYLYAYLRPRELLAGRAAPAVRQRHRELIAAATLAYRQERVRAGATPEQVRLAIRRGRLYEAATLFKIAHRRINRCQAPRPGERAALQREVTALLDLWSQDAPT